MSDGALLGGVGLTKWYGANCALRDATMEVRAGEVVALLGDNGAGKSTLIHILSGALQPDGGTVLVNGEPIAFRSPAEARHRGIETIYQDLALAPHLDVATNVFLGRERLRRLGFLRVLDKRGMREEATRVLANLKVPITDTKARVENLSGGQRQGVALARALYWNAHTVIMDEPTGALGVPQQRRVLELIQSVRDQGAGIVFITHNLQQVDAVADRVVVLRQGRIVANEPKDAVSEHELVTLMVGGTANGPQNASSPADRGEVSARR